MRLLPEKLLDTAARTPEAYAVQQGTAKITYGELAECALGLAHRLIDAGLKPGDRVALLAEPSADYVAAYYGTLLAGGAIVALNTAARADEIVSCIEHAEAALLIVDGSHPEVQQVCARMATSVRVLSCGNAALTVPHEVWAPQHRAHGTASTLPLAKSDALASLIYTSGTTGRPKAIMLSHANLAANTDSIVQYLQLTQRDSIVCVLPFYYSYGGSILHTHIAAGARMVLEANLVYPHRVVETISREAVTGFAGVPATFALLASRVPLERYDLSGLRYLTQAGGPMSPALTQRIRSLLPRARLFVMYGQTEASARLTYLPPERLEEKIGSVGIPIPGVALEVRDAAGNPVPAGASGEVWVKGENVMLGYWKDPVATHNALVDGWLRTGDAGRLDADGFLHLEGRCDDMIKVGAHRVFPRDIEAVIEALPGVEEVAVVGENDELLGQIIKACVVLEPGARVDETRVKAECRAHLAAYKLPKIVEFLPALPKTSSGKVRRRLLRSAAEGLAS